MNSTWIPFLLIFFQIESVFERWFNVITFNFEVEITWKQCYFNPFLPSGHALLKSDPLWVCIMPSLGSHDSVSRELDWAAFSEHMGLHKSQLRFETASPLSLRRLTQRSRSSTGHPWSITASRDGCVQYWLIWCHQGYRSTGESVNSIRKRWREDQLLNLVKFPF